MNNMNMIKIEIPKMDREGLELVFCTFCNRFERENNCIIGQVIFKPHAIPTKRFSLRISKEAEENGDIPKSPQLPDREMYPCLAQPKDEEG